MSPYERGLVRSPRKTDAILEKALGSRFHDTPEGPGWEPPVRHLGDFSRVKLLQEWKRFQAFLTTYLQGNALLRPRILRQIYSVRKCDQRSRNFQPSWKKTFPWLRFIERKMYCATCVDSNKSTERLANPNSTFVTGTDNFRLDWIRSHESSIPHVQVTMNT